MSKEVRNTPIEDLDLSIRSFGLLQELGVKTVGELLDRPTIVIPEDWPRKIGKLVATELFMLCEDLGTPYEGQLVVPPPSPAEHKATGTVAERWQQIRAWLAEHHPSALQHFRPGATGEQIAVAEAALGVMLPSDYKEFLQLADGQEEFSPWVGLGSLFPIADVVEAKQNIVGEETPVDAGSVDPGVRAVDYSEQWIPISRSARGRDYLCIDLGPAPGGTIGQIVEYIVDSNARRVVAKSFADLLALYFEHAQTGEIDFDEASEDEDNGDE